MAKAQLTKNWTISPNVRLTPFVSLTATMGWWLYENKTAMLAVGWTLVGTSDGTTAAFDGIGGDRWPSPVGASVRGTVAAAPQSWALLQNVDGVQVLFAYQGAGVSPTGDDIARVSMSMGGLFVLAGTTTHQPTATDEVLCTSANSIINSTASGDRVMSIGCTTESWWCVLYRASVCLGFFAIEKFDAAPSTTVLAKPYIVSRLTDLRMSTANTGLAQGGVSSAALGVAGFTGCGTRVFTDGAFRNIRTCGTILFAAGPGGATSTTTGFPAQFSPLQESSLAPLLPLFWFGENSTSCGGYLGNPIDWWQIPTTLFNSATTSYVQGDMIAGLDPGDTQATALRSNWLVAFQTGVVRPWRNAAASLQVS